MFHNQKIITTFMGISAALLIMQQTTISSAHAGDANKKAAKQRAQITARRIDYFIDTGE